MPIHHRALLWMVISMWAWAAADTQFSSGYSAPSSSYSPPRYNEDRNDHDKREVVHNHYHYYNPQGGSQGYPALQTKSSGYQAPTPAYVNSNYQAPAPAYVSSNYQAPAAAYYQPSYYSPPNQYSSPSYYYPQPSYGYPSSHHGGHRPYSHQSLGGFYDDDEYLHINKNELVKGTLLFGAGVLKGFIVTSLLNSVQASTQANG